MIKLRYGSSSRKRCQAAILLSLLAGCSLSATEQQFFQLPESARGKLQVKQVQNNCSTLLIHEMQGNSFLNSRRIVFSADPFELGAYQYASWIEPPPARLTFLLRELLQESGKFQSVSLLSGSAVGELELDTELVDFSHDTSTTPGEVRVAIRAALVNLKSRTVLSEENFRAKVRVVDFTSKGAVLAFSQASEDLLPMIAAWTIEHSCHPKE